MVFRELLTLCFDLVNSGRIKAAQELVHHAAARGYISGKSAASALTQIHLHHIENRKRF